MGADYRAAKRAIEAAYRARHRDRIHARVAAYRAAHHDQALAAKARYRAAHPERARASTARYYAANRERIRAAARAVYAANPEREKDRTAKYRAAHGEMVCAATCRRRARSRGAPGRGISAAEWFAILHDSLGLCAYCGKRTKLMLDHIVALSRGGEHDTVNAAAACVSCNSSKNDASLLVWMARRRLTDGRR